MLGAIGRGLNHPSQLVDIVLRMKSCVNMRIVDGLMPNQWVGSMVESVEKNRGDGVDYIVDFRTKTGTVPRKYE